MIGSYGSTDRQLQIVNAEQRLNEMADVRARADPPREAT
jgi:hypothetical protein